MTITARMILQMEAAEAKAETVAVTGEVKKLTTATTDLAAKSKAAASASGAEAAAKVRNAQASREMAAANRSAAGATGNLVAQFNDIGMMLAAGQNPLMLAAQQGSQITQAFAGQGASGAAKMLGAALVQMVNPLNLITFGVIAAGGAMIQWLTSADAEAETLNAELERQKAALEGIVAETESLRLQRGMLLSGAKSEDEQRVLEQINQLMNERAAIEEKLAGNFAGPIAGFRKQELEDQRAALDAQIASLNATEAENVKQRELKASVADTLKGVQTMQSVMAAVGNANISGPWANVLPSIRAAIGLAENYAAAMMAGQSGDNLDKLLGNTGQTSAPDAVRTKLGGGGLFTPVVRGAGLATPRAAGGGGGGGAARDEASALQELITSLEAEIAALHTQDPIQQEMLKHREALAGATEAERAKVEELIATREREAMLMEGATARAQFFEDIGTQALDALIMKGESFNDVLKGVIGSLLQAIAQAAIFGSGPFGSLFGGTSILSGLFPALGAGKAAGGMVHGPGDGSIDTFLTPTANGEFIVNARATAKNRHLLEAINSGGRIGGFAQGGMVGGDTRRASARGAASVPSTIYMDLRGVQGDLAIEEKVRKGAAEVVKMYDREGLPSSMQRVSGDPRRRG